MIQASTMTLANTAIALFLVASAMTVVSVDAFASSSSSFSQCKVVGLLSSNNNNNNNNNNKHARFFGVSAALSAVALGNDQQMSQRNATDAAGSFHHLLDIERRMNLPNQQRPGAKDIVLDDDDEDDESERTPVVHHQKSFHDRLAIYELRLMSLIQDIPGLKGVSMAVHYSLLPQVVTPALAILVWLVSLPKAASLICFVCFSDILNTAIKWAFQRPRPLWYHDSSSSSNALRTKTTVLDSNTWEADYSFPSAHTQFFAGLAFCACVLSGCSGSNAVTLAWALGFGTLVGVTRNYLGVHWPTDTSIGLLLGGVLGTLWGKYDPYSWLLQRGSPMVSLAVATGLTGSLALLLAVVRDTIRPVDETTHAQWCHNLQSHMTTPEPILTDEESSDPTTKLLPRPREIRSKIAMLSTIWCTLAFTAFCPAHLPSAMQEPGCCFGGRVMQAMVGLSGLGGSGVVLKRTLIKRLGAAKLATKTTFKGLAYAGICAWTFLLTQLLSHRILALMG